LPDSRRMGAEQTEQKRHEIPESPRAHLMPIPMNSGFAAKR
jgi:hypothetical protein